MWQRKCFPPTFLPYYYTRFGRLWTYFFPSDVLGGYHLYRERSCLDVLPRDVFFLDPGLTRVLFAGTGVFSGSVGPSTVRGWPPLTFSQVRLPARSCSHGPRARGVSAKGPRLSGACKTVNFAQKLERRRPWPGKWYYRGLIIIADRNGACAQWIYTPSRIANGTWHTSRRVRTPAPGDRPAVIIIVADLHPLLLDPETGPAG